MKPVTSQHRPGKVRAPGTLKFRLRDSTRIDYARSGSIYKEAGAGARGGIKHTAANAKECDIEGNYFETFESVTE